MTTKWTLDAERTLLSYIRDHPSFWQPKDQDYYRRDLRQRKLKELVLRLKSLYPGLMDTVTPEEIRRKLKNIRTYFNREVKKAIKRKTGSGADESFQCKWPLFNDCLFLKGIIMDQIDDTLDISEHSVSQDANLENSEDPEPITIKEEEQSEISDEEITENPVLESYPSPSSSFASLDVSIPSSSDPPSKKRKKQSEQETCLEIRHDISQSLAAGPEREKKDENRIDPFCISLSETLQSLPRLKREKAKLELQKTLVQFLEENGLE